MPCLKSILVHQGKTIATNLEQQLAIHAELAEPGVYSWDTKFVDFDYCHKNAIPRDELPPPAHMDILRQVTDPNFEGWDHVEAEILQKADTFATPDAARTVLHSVFLSHKNNHIVSTDGRRLYRCGKKWDSLDKSVIVPRSTVALLPKKKQVIDLTVPETSGYAPIIIFNWQAPNQPLVSLVSKTVEGNYPNYLQVIPKELEKFTSIYPLDAFFKDYLSSLGRKFIDEEKPHLVFKKEHVEVNGKHFPYSRPPENPLEKVAFNPQFLLDAKKAGFTEIYCKEWEYPGICKTENELLVTMPIRRN